MIGAKNDTPLGYVLIYDESCPREGEGVVCRGAVLAPEDNVYHGTWGGEPKIRAGKPRPYIY